MTWVLLRIFVWGAIMAGLGFLCYNGGNIPLTILAFVVSVIFAVAEIDEYRDQARGRA
jgi:hypothetical protein